MQFTLDKSKVYSFHGFYDITLSVCNEASWLFRQVYQTHTLLTYHRNEVQYPEGIFHNNK